VPFVAGADVEQKDISARCLIDALRRVLAPFVIVGFSIVNVAFPIDP
jgi:hypothetical protein